MSAHPDFEPELRAAKPKIAELEKTVTIYQDAIASLSNSMKGAVAEYILKRRAEEATDATTRR